MRPADIACRYGGEEFLVIMPNTSHETAKVVAERIRARVEGEPFIVNKGYDSLDITMSGGVSTTFPPDDDPDQLIKRADEALYRAKEAGRNQILSGESKLENY